MRKPGATVRVSVVAIDFHQTSENRTQVAAAFLAQAEIALGSGRWISIVHGSFRWNAWATEVLQAATLMSRRIISGKCPNVS